MLEYHHDLLFTVLEIIKFLEIRSILVRLWQTHFMVKQTVN